MFGIKDKFCIMKYKRGSIVEVFTTDKVRCHSWRCAQILSGNGLDYTVSYDVYPGFTNKEDVGHVSGKSIRPCPPLVEFSECWVPGDMVEVFHNLSWKMAIVSKVLGWDQFLVRLVGSFHEFEVFKSEFRVRQSWQNDEWIVIGKKVPRNTKDGRHNELLKHNLDPGTQDKQMDAKRNLSLKDPHFDSQNNNLLEPHIVSSKTLKRGSPCCYSPGEANEGSARKFRGAEKEGRRHQVLGTSPQKVDAIATTREILCEKDGHTCFENRAINVERETINGTYGCSRALRLDLSDDDRSVTSSVGSCSIHSSMPLYGTYCKSDTEDHGSDAESVCPLRYQERIDHQSPTNEALAAEIHRLELHAYRCTMEALHASGPLNWEKETMVTNLRMSLHISNDEHLIELKNLISAASNIRNR